VVKRLRLWQSRNAKHLKQGAISVVPTGRSALPLLWSAPSATPRSWRIGFAGIAAITTASRSS